MKIKNLLLGLTIVFALGACGDDEDDNGGSSGAVNCQTAFINLGTFSQAVLDAQDDYSMDDSPANCNAYKDALNEFIDEFESAVDNCDDPVIAAQLATFDTFADQYRSIIAMLTCS